VGQRGRIRKRGGAVELRRGFLAGRRGVEEHGVRDVDRLCLLLLLLGGEKAGAAC
jgi:hypothetical protein